MQNDARLFLYALVRNDTALPALREFIENPENVQIQATFLHELQKLSRAIHTDPLFEPFHPQENGAALLTELVLQVNALADILREPLHKSVEAIATETVALETVYNDWAQHIQNDPFWNQFSPQDIQAAFHQVMPDHPHR